jgi:hypothetical protein
LCDGVVPRQAAAVAAAKPTTALSSGAHARETQRTRAHKRSTKAHLLDADVVVERDGAAARLDERVGDVGADEVLDEGQLPDVCACVFVCLCFVRCCRGAT